MKSDFDLDLGEDGLDQGYIEGRISQCLREKGFCVLRLDYDVDLLNQAYDAAVDLKRDGLMEGPPEQLLEGLLGPEGTKEFCKLKQPEEGEDDLVGEELRRLAARVDQIASLSSSFCASIGFDAVARSEPMLIRGGENFEVPELTEESCSYWLSTFLRAKIMAVYFLGEGDGALELQPLDDVSEAVSLVTSPDMLVLLRSDVLSHRHIATNSEYALTTFVLSPEPGGTRGWGLAPGSGRHQAHPLQVVRELDAWAKTRLQTLMSLETESKLGEDVPREWQLLMHHSFFRQNHCPVAVRGQAGHCPGIYDNEAFWKSLNYGPDYQIEVPIMRWDHDLYYDPDPNSYQWSTSFLHGGRTRTSVRHGQFIDGIDLFDNKFFSLSVMEAKGMDPMQRHILETSYEALHGAGYIKKDLMQAYIAVFTGCTNPEWNYIDKEAGACSGTGSSQAITSNRTSFVLGIMGPSTSIDCEMSSAGMALMLGATAVAPNNERRTTSGGDSQAAVSGGVFLSITPFMWPRFNAWMNPIGRCFSFDKAAGGYVRGETCISVCLKPYSERVDGELVITDAPCVGTVVGWRMTNNGRSAGLTMPSGPAEQEAIYESMRHANISPLDIDAMECHCVGNLLGDGVEVSATASVLRGSVEGGDREPLVMSSVKTNVGAQCEATAMSAFVKVLFNILYANNAPTVHLKQINPHIDLGNAAIAVNNESLAYRDARVFHGVSSRGLGGTNVNLLCWYHADDQKVPVVKRPVLRGNFEQWPGGRGLLDWENKTREEQSEYYIQDGFVQCRRQDREEDGATRSRGRKGLTAGR